ncbi:sensor histidine kinase [Rubrolithibacter danxiaensis]|uniref:sensor histidine kinase n=1 Tax=Rubrolithibacter danxiaensis TaxID=3390805 RepID=UPI003BF83540
MKLVNKLTFFITISKLAIVLLFVLILPALVERIAFQYTNYYLRQQQQKVMDVVSKNGVDFYLQGEKSYGSYTMLKEEYIALEPVETTIRIDTIETAQRIVEQDTLTYRILSHSFKADKQNYLLEIGKTTATIDQYNRPLQKIALYVLIGLVLITLLIDILVTRLLVKPLGLIIKTKLVNQRFPFNEDVSPVKTSTIDFKYLDNSLILLMDQINEAFEKEREFTANASHELMTPISILQSKIENLMLHEEVNETVQQRLIEMMKSLNRLKKIVNSLLLISRIENEQFVKKDSIAVSALIEEIIEEIGHRLEEKQIKISMELRAAATIINCNKTLLFQLFYNLINNAIKYNKADGEIKITDTFNVKNQYEIKIADTGIGVPESQLNSIFERFRKANLSKSPGYGLGLAIVKSIVNYHDIDLQVQSEVNVGTVFTIVFPPGMILQKEIKELH